jgi:hypothetical protein
MVIPPEITKLIDEESTGRMFIPPGITKLIDEKSFGRIVVPTEIAKSGTKNPSHC